MLPDTAPAAGAVITSAWPELSIATFKDHVTARNGTGESLLHFYTTKHGSTAPQDEWKQRIENGQISVGGVTVCDPAYILRTRAVLEYRRTPWREPPAPNWLKIVFVDDDLVAIDKPAGLQVLPNGPFHHRCVLMILKDHFGSLPPAPTHRLGRGTSGLLLCARSLAARRQLAADFTSKTQQQGCGGSGGASLAAGEQEQLHQQGKQQSGGGRPAVTGSAQPKRCQQQHAVRNLRKLYLAMVTGCPAADSGTVDVPIGRTQHAGLCSSLHVADATHGKSAKSMWHVVRLLPQQNAAVLAVEIFSGRPHQIRIHMATMGHPLMGDPLYVAGGTVRPAGAGLAVGPGGLPAAMPGDTGYSLHSWQLKLCHPTTGQPMHLVADPPSPFKEALEGAAKYIWT